MWKLVRDSGVLDVNSPYCYLILCKSFADTCAVAERDCEVVGFVTGYRPPSSSNVFFIWQIGVAEAARGQGLGAAMVLSLLKRESCRGVSHLEATVTPSNLPSKRLFQSVARSLQAQLEEQPCFAAELFPDGGHEPENLIRIGPFDIANQVQRRHSGNNRTP
jgi:L-2,4-diaminobutyric acid acetyltransferase